MVKRDQKIKNQIESLLLNGNFKDENEHEICQALLDRFVEDRKRLDSILQSADKREYKLKETKEQLELLLEESSKLAVIGEMVDAIAHQWSQPLGIISLYTKMVVEDFNYGDVNEEYLTNFSNKVETQIQHLVETLHEFRSFFRPDKTSANFSMSEIIKSVLNLMQDVIKGNQINLSVHIETDFQLSGAKNEFKHVIINLINNAKDIFIERHIQNKKINILVDIIDNIGVIEISDNGGGIPEDVLPKIFLLHFTTKEAKGGTGVGLHLSKTIIKKINGDLTAHNHKDGAVFKLTFPKFLPFDPFSSN